MSYYDAQLKDLNQRATRLLRISSQQDEEETQSRIQQSPATYKIHKNLSPVSSSSTVGKQQLKERKILQKMIEQAEIIAQLKTNLREKQKQNKKLEIQLNSYRLKSTLNSKNSLKYLSAESEIQKIQDKHKKEIEIWRNKCKQAERKFKHQLQEKDQLLQQYRQQLKNAKYRIKQMNEEFRDQISSIEQNISTSMTIVDKELQKKWKS